MSVDLYPSRTLEHPSISERKDPVVYQHALDRAPIASEAIRAYQNDGFIVLPGLLSADEVATLRAEADALRGQADRLDTGTVIVEPGRDDSGAVRSVFAVHQQSPAFAALVQDERLAGLARFLLDDDVYVHQSRVNYKPAFRGKEFYWHSDFETWHVEDGMPRMRALSMSVMLTDNHAQAGPTMFVPGSHLSYVACVGATPEDHYKSSLRKQEYGVPDPASLTRLVRNGGIEAPTPRAGSVVVFDCNTMHGSNGNITPFERMNVFFVFNAWSNRLVTPFGGTRPRPEFIAHRRVAGPLRVAADAYA